MSYYGSRYPFYYPQYISGYEEVKITTMKPTIIKEMEQHTEILTYQIVIFGATGDLCRRKLIPALFKLHDKKLIPYNLVIVGTSRRENSKQSWVETLGDYPEEFLNRLDWVSTDLENPETLHHLPDADDTTYFLSVPPERYESAIINLKQGGLLDDPETSRVVIEKPFGYDLKSANHLQSVVGRNLREKQVYRIDHYLGKDTVNNILATRFGNILLEPLWNRECIEEVQIYATETIGCEGRSQYYETAGVVRDMLQNHMLQVLALIAMEAPCRMDAKEIRREKVKVLSATHLGEDMILGQYETYKSEEGVNPKSNTPTFVAGSLFIDNWRWKGVPFSLYDWQKDAIPMCRSCD